MVRVLLWGSSHSEMVCGSDEKQRFRSRLCCGVHSDWTIDDCLWSLILVLKTKEIVQGLEIIKVDSNEDPQHYIQSVIQE